MRDVDESARAVGLPVRAVRSAVEIAPEPERKPFQIFKRDPKRTVLEVVPVDERPTPLPSPTPSPAPKSDHLTTEQRKAVEDALRGKSTAFTRKERKNLDKALRGKRKGLFF